MKLIIPMAGRGTRLRPHTHVTPKPLLKVCGTMIVERILQIFHKTLDADITEIVFILGPDFGDKIEQQLRDMSERNGLKASFYIQETARGTAHAIYSAAPALEGEIICVFADTLFDTTTKVNVKDADSVIWLKHVDDPSRFGVAVHKGDTITDFVEKPKEPISNLAIIGVYYFKEGLALKKEIEYLLENNITGHGNEYQLTDALDRLLKSGKTFKAATVDEWLDCGTLDEWIKTSGIIANKERTKHSSGTNVTIHEPVYIGKNVTLEHVTLGPNVMIEDGAVVKHSTLVNSIVLEQANVQHVTAKNSSIGMFARVSKVKGTIHVGDHSSIEG